MKPTAATIVQYVQSSDITTVWSVNPDIPEDEQTTNEAEASITGTIDRENDETIIADIRRIDRLVYGEHASTWIVQGVAHTPYTTTIVAEDTTTHQRHVYTIVWETQE